MGGCFMISTTRIKRQSAIRLFAQEYSESNLTEQGVGEYDPSFVITKLGIKAVSYTHLTLPTICSV